MRSIIIVLAVALAGCGYTSPPDTIDDPVGATTEGEAMKVSDAEREAIRIVIRLGAQHGYGNLMQHMATAWAKDLVDKYQFDEESARQGALLDGYPFLMQQDIIERGEWDDTGERYRKEPCGNSSS